MLDNGYFLKRFEVLNWGNFSGFQKFSLRGEGPGGLFAEPSSSAILGVNGSGKSTLIDGFMITMLPFEKSLKLGVTNDVETGSSGGRSVRDYVLGKYASMGITSEVKHEDVYSRKTGCSILLLNFSHAGGNNKNLSVGRIWWYREGRLLDNSLFFICHKDTSIGSFCPQGQLPISAKSFKEKFDKKMEGLEIFETADAYFNSLSTCIGGIKKEDLKLLNRAFYVKSISNIDQFIRENMLIESESPHLDILLQNVRSGQEISETIKICEHKIEIIEGILHGLQRMQEISLQRDELRHESAVYSIYPDWQQLDEAKKEKDILAQEIQKLELMLPQSQSSVEDLQKRYLSTQAALNQSSDFQNLQLIKERIESAQRQLKMFRTDQELVQNALTALELKAPKSFEELPIVINKIQNKKSSIEIEKDRLRTALSEKFFEKESLNKKAELFRQELQHLQTHKNLIPQSLYAVKIAACEALKIPKSHLMFVGEVLQIPKQYEEARRAVESVLDPISKNLLCHPDSLDKFTKWLNSQNLSANIIVKRIESEDLKAEFRSKTLDNSILKFIEVLSPKENLFHDYVWKWLQDVFDYQIVDLKEFRKKAGKLVTLEGLVKSDQRTMKKLRGDLRFVLGWNPAERIAEVVEELSQLNSSHLAIESSINELRKQELACEQSLRSLEQLLEPEAFDFLAIKQTKKQLDDLILDEQMLLEKNKDLDKLKEEVEQLHQIWQEKSSEYFSLKAQFDSHSQRFKDVQGHIILFETKFKNSCNVIKIDEGSEEWHKVATQLQGIHGLLKKGKSFSELQFALHTKIERLGEQRESLAKTATGQLERYKSKFHDPNLSFRIPDGDLSQFQNDWTRTHQILISSEIVTAKEKFREFFDHILLDSVKATINEFKSQVQDVQKNIQSINAVLKLVNYEDLPTEKRYLQIIDGMSPDERVLRFRQRLSKIETILSPTLRTQVENLSEDVMSPLMIFVEEMQRDTSERYFVTDVRNHFYFQVHSFERRESGPDIRKEEFVGAKKDAKSSAQTTQLAYTLLASSLAYRFKFNDPILGKNTLRCLILDEFGGKFDNEKPKDIVALLEKMGFQPLLVSPMSKADLLADRLSHLVMVHKVSSKESKVCSYPIVTRDEYDRVLKQLSMQV